MVKERNPLTIGERFGRLVVVERASDRVCPSRTRPAYECLCDCGKSITTTSNLLKRGETVSCGCRQREIGYLRLTHGMCDSHTYQSWAHMKQRCGNTNCKEYPDYGGRGITILDGWEDFSKFYEDMGDCPVGLSLDRVDTLGHYERANCKWSTPVEQATNTRKRSSNTSGRTGVAWHKKTGKWQAGLKTEGVYIYAGLYSNFDDAVTAREQLELKYRGKIRTAAYEARPDLENKGVEE